MQLENKVDFLMFQWLWCFKTDFEKYKLNNLFKFNKLKRVIVLSVFCFSI